MYVLVWYNATELVPKRYQSQPYVTRLADPKPFHGYVHVYGYVSCTSTRYCEHLLISLSTRLTPCLLWSVTYSLIAYSNTTLLVYKAPAPIERTLKRLKDQNDVWQFQGQHIRHFIDECASCQKMSMLKISIHARGFTTSTYTPMECLNIDFIGPFHDKGYILVDPQRIKAVCLRQQQNRREKLSTTPWSPRSSQIFILE